MSNSNSVVYKIGVTMLFLCMIASVSFAVNCGGNVACQCGDTLTSSRTMVWNQDRLSACATPTILSIAASNVVLDCNGGGIGPTLNGSAPNSVLGIRIVPPQGQRYSNIEIHDCYIYNTGLGIDTYRVDGLTLRSNVIRNEVGGPLGMYQVRVDDSNQFTITGNSFHGKAFYGLLLANAHDGEVSLNDFSPLGDLVTGGLFIHDWNYKIRENQFHINNSNPVAIESGLWLDGTAQPDAITDNRFYINNPQEKTYAIYNTQEEDVPAKYNYWFVKRANDWRYDPTPDANIATYVYDEADFPAYGRVTYLPRSN